MIGDRWPWWLKAASWTIITIVVALALVGMAIDAVLGSP